MKNKSTEKQLIQNNFRKSISENE